MYPAGIGGEGTLHTPHQLPSTDDADSLPYPLNLPDEEKFAVLRSMSPTQRSELNGLVSALSTQRRRRWVASLRSQFPSATEADFRQIVIGRILDEGEEERRIERQIAARDAARRGEAPSS